MPLHHMALKAAVKKYISLLENGGTEQELRESLSLDEKEYEPADVEDIIKAINAERASYSNGDQGNGPNNPPPPPPPTPEKEKQPKAKTAVAEKKTVKGFDEYRMERVGDKLEKLKKLRSGVIISEEEAEVLNTGASSPGATNPIMYFPAE